MRVMLRRVIYGSNLIECGHDELAINNMPLVQGSKSVINNSYKRSAIANQLFSQRLKPATVVPQGLIYKRKAQAYSSAVEVIHIAWTLIVLYGAS